MKFLCCFSSPDLTEPLPDATGDVQGRYRVRGTASSTYIVPDNMKASSGVLHGQDSEMTQEQSCSEIQAPERSRYKSTMSSPAPDAHDNSDEELVTTGKSAAQWKEDEAKAKPAPSQSTSSGEEWRRWKDNPAVKDYAILNTLGRGAFADVVLGKHRTTSKHHALKVVYLNKPGLKDKHIAVLQREGTYLRKLQHKNIVRCLRVYQAQHQWVFVLEYLKGGMLLNDLAKLKRYSEKTAAAVFRQVLSAVAYLHENNIVHRDIKPENVVFKHSVNNSAAFSKDNIVKLVDFGMILDLSKEPHSRGMMGSPGFVAPEVILGQHHTSQMDNYSLGVLLFVMLVGAKPMTQDQARSMQYALMTPESLRGMHDPRWRALTESAKDLILKLLQPDPKNRYTAKQALNHRWIKGARDDSILDGSVMEGWADHVQLMQHAYMGTPSPFGANYGGANLHMRNGGLLSPHTAAYRHKGASRGIGSSSSARGAPGVPASPLAVVSNTGHIGQQSSQLQQDSRTPTWTGAGGTPTGGGGDGTSPFAWPAGGDGTSQPLSAPLSQQFTDVAQKTVHDEVMKHAHEKLVQAQRYFMAAQVMRQADSGRLATPSATSATGAPPSPSRPNISPRAPGRSGGLGTDGSEATQWASRHDTSLSAVAQSYMSTQNNSGMAAGASGPHHGATSGRSGKHRPQDLDAVVKDAKNLMNELNKAPSLSSFEAAQAQAAQQSGADPHAFDAAVAMLTSEATTPGGRRRDRSTRRIKSQTSMSAHSASRGGGGGNMYRASTTPRSARANNGSRSLRSARGAAAHENIPLPRSILEQPIADPARDAYYGGAVDDESAALTPTARKGRSGKHEGPRSTRSKRGPHSRRSVTPRSTAPRSPSHARFVALVEPGMDLAM